MINNCLIILNYNDVDTTRKLVEIVKEYQTIDKIIIVDNCSTDMSYSILKSYQSEKIDVIITDENRGYASGNNKGAFYSIKKYNPKVLFFANPDVAFKESAISAMSEVLLREKKIAIIAPKVKEGYNIWDLPMYWGTIRSLFLILFTLHKRKVARSMKKDIEEVGVVEGSFFAIKSEIFKKINGFDERTFLYLEENILAQKILREGYTEAVLTKVYYLHEHSKSIKKEYHSKTNAFRLFKPSYYIYLKYYLNCNNIQIILFDLCYFIGFLERIVYDLVDRLKMK